MGNLASKRHNHPSLMSANLNPKLLSLLNGTLPGVNDYSQAVKVLLIIVYNYRP